MFSPKPKSNLVQNVTDAIGTAVENECMMRYYERNVPGLLKYIKDKYWHKSSGTHQKVKNVITLMNRADVKHWQPWGIGYVLNWVAGCWIVSANHLIGS